MVDCHGSQCGFCTPGFVMSLFALYRSERSPSRRRVEDALAGNLCRCTGYRPILDAAQKMYELAPPDAGWLARPCVEADAEPSPEETALASRLRSLRRRGTLEIHGTSALGSPRAFWAPRTLDDLAALYAEHPDAHLLAGGTDVGLWITKQHRDLEEVIYTGEVAELQRLDVVDGWVEIGAAVTVTDAMGVLGEHYPDLGEVYRRFGSPPIRNAATLGGNVANGSPIGDSMPALIALGSTVVLRRGAERRELPLDELYLGYRQTAMRPGELIEAVRVPVFRPAGADPARRFATYKVSKRFDQDISAVCAAFALRLAGDPTNGQRIAEARVCYGGMAAVPKRAAGCEAALLGRPWDEDAVAAGMEALDGDFDPISDMRASAAYRRTVARNLLRRFFLESGAGGGDGPAMATRVVERAVEGDR
jgi:xanthine dehydrogenase small subunit